jgi:tetratricopeptide (TPR) repeat protein
MIGKDGWERYADALAERAASVFEASITGDLFLRLGKVTEAQLSDLPRAAEAYARAAEQGGDNADVLAALERVYAGLDDTKALVDVLERRIGIENDPAARADLHHRLAALQIGPIGDKAQGLATLRLALESVPEHEKSQKAVEQLLADDVLFDDAWSTLEGVYRSTNRGADLGRLYAKRVERADTTQARTRARLDLAQVLENEGSDPLAAQGAVEEAVVENPYDPDPLPELERLAEKNDHWAQAADALRRALTAQDRMSLSQSGPNLSTIAAGAELWTRLARWLRDRVKDAQGAEEAFTRASELDPENIDLVRAIEELRRGPGRERDRIASLRRLAKLEGEPDKKRELTRDAAQIAETVLGDAKLAEEVLRGLLAENEADAWAAAELTRLREGAGDHEEVLTLLLKRAEAEGDGQKAVELRHRAAEIAEVKIGDRERAIGLYEEIFEHDRSDRRAQERLRALYAALGKLTELARLLGQLVEHADNAVDRSALRMEIARLELEKFESPTDATDTLRAVLDEEPDHLEAGRLLAKIFEETEKFSELADLQGQLVERARANGDPKLEVDRMMILGEILEEKVKDDRRALETYETVLDRDPGHHTALEAVARLAEVRAVWDKAASAVERLAELASGEDAVALWLRLARARQELGDDAGVENALEHALTADPRDTNVRERLAQLYERTGKWAELAALLVGNADMVRDGNPPWDPAPAPAVNTRSIAPGATSNAPPQAVPTYVLDQTKLLRRAAEIHLKERRSAADAVPILERAAQLVPHDRELLLALVDAYTAAKRERDAAQVLERVIASFGGKRTKELSLYHHRLGRALASLGDKDIALTQLDMAFKIDPGSIEVLRDLGVLALETNDLDRAQKTFRALLLQRLDGSSGISKGEVFYYLGEISMKQGDKAKAVQMLERAVENEPNLARAKEMLSGLKGASS